uniref:Uncharacterized protein n=1 Tax=Lepeophtheirus salmonis TaxID=72036 RepID=A0A0K2VFS9_LEPSM
MNFWTRTTSPP